MTDEPDLCCTHGEPILQRLDRLVELMEIVAETRTGNLATGGVVKGRPKRLVVEPGGVDCLMPSGIDEAYLWTKDHPLPDAIRFHLNKSVKAKKAPESDQD